MEYKVMKNNKQIKVKLMKIKANRCKCNRAKSYPNKISENWQNLKRIHKNNGRIIHF